LRKEDTVRFVKARRISWTGHVERMEDSRMPTRAIREKIYTKRRRGRPKVRWLDDVQKDLRAMGIEGWRGKGQDKRLVEANSTGGQGSRRAVAQGGGGSHLQSCIIINLFSFVLLKVAVMRSAAILGFQESMWVMQATYFVNTTVSFLRARVCRWVQPTTDFAVESVKNTQLIAISIISIQPIF
jgi:hypothetical protein